MMKPVLRSLLFLLIAGLLSFGLVGQVGATPAHSEPADPFDTIVFVHY